MKQTVFAVVIAILATIAGNASSSSADNYLTGGDFLIRNVTVVDGLGNKPQVGQDILIRGGKIASITGAGTSQPPSGARVIEGNGLTAMPGLIDAHTHIRTQWHGGLVLQDKYPQNRQHKNLQQNLAAYLYAGVTGIFNVGDPDPAEYSVKIDTGDPEALGKMMIGGTDSPAYPTLWAGESMHRELELMVMAGISPLDAIKSCTYNGAKIMRGEARYGSPQTGMEADLMLVKGRPWKNISDTRNIQQVFLKGKLVDRDKLLQSWR